MTGDLAGSIPANVGGGHDDAGALLHTGRNPLERIQHALHRYPVISPALVLAISCVVFAILSDGRFQRPATIGIMLQQTAVMAALAIGQTLIVLTAGVDLAVGTSMLLVHLVVAKLVADQGVPALLALLAGAAVGMLHRRGPRRARHAAPITTVHRHARHVLRVPVDRTRLQQGRDDVEGGARRSELAVALDRQGDHDLGRPDHDGRRAHARDVRRVRLHPLEYGVGPARVRDRRRSGGRPARRHQRQSCADERVHRRRVGLRPRRRGCSSDGRCRPAATRRPTSTSRRSPRS